MRRKRVGDMAAASRDIECAPALLRRGSHAQPLQALAERVRRRGEIAGGVLTELFLHESLGHADSRSVLEPQLYRAWRKRKPCILRGQARLVQQSWGVLLRYHAGDDAA